MHETVPVVGKVEERGERAARPFLGRAPHYSLRSFVVLRG